MSEKRATFQYIVQNGDTVNSVAARFDSTPSEICRLNRRPGFDHRLLYPGARLTVPVASAPAPASAEAAKTATDQAAGAPRFVRARARLLTRCEGVANGCLLLTPNSLLFQPSLSDPLVIDRGPEAYCVARPMGHVTSLTAYTSPELIATRPEDRPGVCDFRYRPAEEIAADTELPPMLYLCFGCRGGGGGIGVGVGVGVGGKRAAAAGPGGEEFWFSAGRADADALFEFCQRCGVGDFERRRLTDTEGDSSSRASSASDGNCATAISSSSDYYRHLLAMNPDPGDHIGSDGGGGAIQLPSRADLPLPSLFDDRPCRRRRRLLNLRRLRHLVAALPSRAEGHNLRLLHSALRDGFSLQSAYRSCRLVERQQRYCLMLIETTEGRVFGAFLSSEPRASERRHYGTGETFVFRWGRPVCESRRPELTGSLQGTGPVGSVSSFREKCPTADDKDPDKDRHVSGGGAARDAAELCDSSDLQHRNDAACEADHNDEENDDVAESEADKDFYQYSWTGENMFFMLGDLDHFSVGSGHGRCAIWLDADLCRGRSQQCDTFNSPVLCGQAEDFLVRDLEIWVFEDPSEPLG